MQNKTEFIANVANKANVSKKVAAEVVNAVIDSVTEELANGGSVQITGFGSFVAKDRPERQCKNPRTGETVTVPATKVPAFKAGNQLKTAVKEGAK